MKKLLVLTLFLIASMILISTAFGVAAPSNSGTFMFNMSGNDNEENLPSIENEVNKWFNYVHPNNISDLAISVKYENDFSADGTSFNGIGETFGSWTTDQNFNFYSLKSANQFDMYWLENPASSGTFYTGDHLTNQNGNAQDLSHITFYTATIPNPVPIPGAAWLLGSGMVGLLALRRRRISIYYGDTIQNY